MTLVNGIFTLIRTSALFPQFSFKDNYDVVVLSYFLEQICFYLATWLFGMKYYEVSLDMERLISVKDD